MSQNSQSSSEAPPHFDQLAYSIKRLSRVADIGRTNLYADIKIGKLKAKKVGNKLVVPIDMAIEYINNLPDAKEG